MSCNCLNPYGTDYQDGAHVSGARLRRLCVALACVLMAVSAAWSYKQLPMTECSWCHRTGFAIWLNRHHVTPQSVDPARRDDPQNLVVLCRACHRCIGHRQNWRTYNPDVVEIVGRYTNSLPCRRGD